MATVPLSQGRIPPHDLDAEQSVLGSLLLDPLAIGRVLTFLQPEDFYRENHAQVYRAALELFRLGEPIDNVTLAAQLQKAGVLDRVGGRAQLAVMQESVPTAANIEYYARIVKEKAYKRRLISAGGSITSFGYDEGLDADEAINRAQSAVYSVADDRLTSDFQKLYDLLGPAMARIEAQMTSGKGLVGIASGFHDLDRLTGGFKDSDLVVIAGRPAMGKALALDTPIPTPDGWKEMGTLKVGDQIFDERGRACTVTHATAVQYERDCYEVVFSDGARIVADADHQWLVHTRAQRKKGQARVQSVVTTRDMLRSLRVGEDRLNYSIGASQPLEYPIRDLPLHPYVLGVWLGDGNTNSAVVTLGDPEIVAELQAVGSAVRPRQSAGTPRFGLGAGHDRFGSKKLDVIGRKHIPREYQHSAPHQRSALLQGLMDTDGTIDRLGHAEFTSSQQQLALDVLELTTSLGLTPRLTVDRARLNGVDLGPRYRVRFKPIDLPIFRLRRKASRQLRVRTRARVRQRYITSVRRVRSVPVRCIQVDSPSHLYLAGNACIPTHNTSLVTNIALHAALEEKKTVAIFSLEMSKEQLVERLLCETAKIDAQRMHRGMLSEAEYENVAQALGPLSEAPIFIDDSPVMDELTLLLKARQARMREGVDMVIVDYLQLMHGRGRSLEDRVQEVSAISRSLKGLARELKLPVLAVSQLSRAPEQRPDKRPILSDLRESGSIEQDADVVMFIFRPEYYKPEERPGLAEIIVSKHRNGPTGTIELKFRRDQTRFYNLESRRPEPDGP